jgi:hypothetical protein
MVKWMQRARRFLRMINQLLANGSPYCLQTFSWLKEHEKTEGKLEILTIGESSFLKNTLLEPKTIILLVAE